MEIKSKRLLLRKIRDDDIKNIFRGLSHPDVIKHYGVSFESIEATKEQMEWFADHEKNETGIWWAVCSKADGTFLGAGGLNDICQEHKKAEIGFWLFPENWGKGFMFEAMSLIFTHSFETIGLKRIEGFVASKNANCKKAVSKLDFILEETKADAEMKDGEFILSLIHI